MTEFSQKLSPVTIVVMNASFSVMLTAYCCVICLARVAISGNCIDDLLCLSGRGTSGVTCKRSAANGQYD